MNALYHGVMRIWFCAAVTACALSACGGGDSGGGAVNDRQAEQDAALRFASCMREHGVDVPDPGPDGQVTSGAPASGPTEAALAACRKEAPKGASADADPSAPAVSDRQLALAKCLRKHGVKATDPEIDETGDNAITVQGMTPGARRACAKLLPGTGPAPGE